MNGGSYQPFSVTNGTQANAMQNAAQAGQYQVPMAGGDPLSVPVAGTFAGSPTAPVATGSQVLPWNFQQDQQPQDPYAAFLRALNQIQMVNPISAVGSTVGKVPPGGMAHRPTGNINIPGYIPKVSQ